MEEVMWVQITQTSAGAGAAASAGGVGAAQVPVLLQTPPPGHRHASPHPPLLSYSTTATSATASASATANDRPAPEPEPAANSNSNSQPPEPEREPELDSDPDPAHAATSNDLYRNSVYSILDDPDPFFLEFSPISGPLTLSAPPLERPSSAADRNDPQSSWPPPRKESLASTSSTPWFDTVDEMESINIAVIGADGVGKSAFIQRALRLPRPPSNNVTSLRQDVDGAPYVVTLIELDLEIFDVDPSQPIQWPKQIGGHMVPRVDGAMILYDVMNKDSVRDLPPTMSALSNSSLPTVLIATKCDTPENLRQLDTEGVTSAFPSCTHHFNTSANVPGSAREALHAMLRAALPNRNGSGERSELLQLRRRAASAANLDVPPDTLNGRPLSQQSAKHNRASSDLSLVRGALPPSSEGYYLGESRSPRLDYQNQTAHGSPAFASDAPEDAAGRTVSSMLRTPGVRLDVTHESSFLDIEESDAESYRYSDDIPILQRNDESLLDRPSKLVGVSFDELVDRLLAPRMSRADNNFADIFLCLYRQFSTPGQLFSAIVARLDRVKDDNTAHYLTKTEISLRIIEVLAKWLALYPGDFARSATKRKLTALVARLATEPVFSAAAQQMRVHLETKVVEDDDTGWANADDPEEEQGSGDATEDADAGGRRPSELAESMDSLHLDEPFGAFRRPSQSSELSLAESAAAGRSPVRFQFHSFEDYEREAATMVPKNNLPLNKFRYHIFMDIDPEDIADEMTRIDWVMFSSIRIRDLVRHVSLSVDQREKCRSLKNVNRMISHFNHVARWVSNIVLIRDKAKHRAPCLEKFMVIALKLRQLNNYNGLAAVLAGINGTIIHRLGQTRALVSQEVQKRFARLVLLMSTQKSHFAYRLAWENSPLPRIPFIPLHRRDLVSAEEGSRTFVGPNGDRINWRKFEVLGEVLLPIMKSQGQPYPNLNKHEGSRDMILDCRMSHDEEDLYQRSIQVEPTSAAMAEAGKKSKFSWLAK